MVKQDQPHRLRRCTPMRSAHCLRWCAAGWFAALVTGCTPLRGTQKSEQAHASSDSAEASDAALDAGVSSVPARQRDADAGTARENAGGSRAAAKPDDTAGTGGQAGDVSPMQTAGSAADSGGAGMPAAGSGGSGASDLMDVTCVPLFVQEARGQFVQVRCQNAIMLGSDRVEYLALPTKALPAACTRFSELASAALLRAAPIGVRVSAAGRGNDSGCETARCRTIRAFSQGQ